MRERKKEDRNVSIPFWIYAIAIVISFLLALFKINNIWAFIGSLILGIIVAVINIIYAHELKWIIIKYLSIILSMNAISLVLSLANITSTIFSLLYLYLISTTSIAVVLMSIFSLIDEN